jgi:hypothetical protein
LALSALTDTLIVKKVGELLVVVEEEGMVRVVEVSVSAATLLGVFGCVDGSSFVL